MLQYLCSIATPDVISQAQFALDIKRKVLPLYEEVFDIEYPLPKLDTLVVGILSYDIGISASKVFYRLATLIQVWCTTI